MMVMMMMMMIFSFSCRNKISWEWNCKEPESEVGDGKITLIISVGSAYHYHAPVNWQHGKIDVLFAFLLLHLAKNYSILEVIHMSKLASHFLLLTKDLWGYSKRFSTVRLVLFPIFVLLFISFCSRPND